MKAEIRLMILDREAEIVREEQERIEEENCRKEEGNREQQEEYKKWYEEVGRKREEFSAIAYSDRTYVDTVDGKTYFSIPVAGTMKNILF